VLSREGKVKVALVLGGGTVYGGRSSTEKKGWVSKTVYLWSFL